MMSGIRLAAARVGDLAAVMRVMDAAFDPTYGEAWTGAQLLTLFALPSARVCLAWDGDLACGFSAARLAGPESELLLLAVELGRASCRESVCQYVLISVVAVPLTKKIKQALHIIPD